MKVGKLSSHKRGWIIGDFQQSLLQTKDFEVGIVTHYKDEKWPAHYHKLGTEYNVLISGSMTMCGVDLMPGDTFIVYPNEVADPIFHEDCVIVCVKVPGNSQDKYLV